MRQLQCRQAAAHFDRDVRTLRGMQSARERQAQGALELRSHLSNALYGDNEHLVVAPWFHDRSMRSGEASQLNPAWTVIRHIPGGWGPEPSR